MAYDEDKESSTTDATTAVVGRLDTFVMPNAHPTPEGIQSAIIVAMKDLEKWAEDTVWITPYETMFERLMELYMVAGGKRETLKEIWPEYVFD